METLSPFVCGGGFFDQPDFVRWCDKFLSHPEVALISRIIKATDDVAEPSPLGGDRLAVFFLRFHEGKVPRTNGPVDLISVDLGVTEYGGSAQGPTSRGGARGVTTCAPDHP